MAAARACLHFANEDPLHTASLEGEQFVPHFAEPSTQGLPIVDQRLMHDLISLVVRLHAFGAPDEAGLDITLKNTSDPLGCINSQ